MDKEKYKSKFQLKYLIIPTFFFINIAAAQAKIECAPIKELLSGHHNDKLGIYSAKKLGDCLDAIVYSDWRKRKNKVDQAFMLRVLEALLPLSKEQKKTYEVTRNGQHLINYAKVVEIIGRLNSIKYVKRYMDFVIFSSNSANEGISSGMAKLYKLNAPEVLTLLAAYSKKDQKEIVDRLATGAVNIYYPRINKSNFRRFIVGIHWDVVNKNYPQRVLSLQIEAAVLKILK